MVQQRFLCATGGSIWIARSGLHRREVQVGGKKIHHSTEKQHLIPFSQLKVHPANTCTSLYVEQPITVGTIPLVQDFPMFAKAGGGFSSEHELPNPFSNQYPDMRKAKKNMFFSLSCS